jgi:hypothetical protein
MSHPCCRACRLRFAPSAIPDPTCARCGEPLSSLAALEAMGYALAMPANPLWRPADLDALARAVADVGANLH